ncbi:DUF1330 domain-containing protein [Limibaculum sp. M0105]|uniref:DUF1330 domain-containing protein n=1 Tax=Thermohalobaculum xanthum TaxID=2753746 RepID=A0A8J7SGX9_9RHOB|nr:DUF1330 domain-containing protein [Thermohalobaculum xanthum]MBK0401323.1 DUF1330 domain-containing protein [Thermohalobaculum xanthum]
MAAYLIVDTKISDPAQYEEYKAKAKPILEKHGGEYLARGGALEVFEADLWHPTRLVVVRFPSMDAARAARDDPAYAEVRMIRQAAAKATLAIVEGL